MWIVCKQNLVPSVWVQGGGVTGPQPPSVPSARKHGPGHEAVGEGLWLGGED